MRLLQVAGLSLVGMLGSSAGVWAFAPAPAGGASEAEPVQVQGAVTQQLEEVATAIATRPGTLSLEARLGHADLPANVATDSFLQVEVTAPSSAPNLPKQALNLAIVIDRSGSMKGARLTNALSAARGMIARLRDGDVVSLIAYSTSVELLAESRTLDSSTRAELMAAVDKIKPQGDTCISCGLEEAMRVLQRRSGMVDRVLLLSDGEPTAGLRDVSAFQVLGERSRRMGCAISSIGLDVDYNERVLLALASSTNGRHHFAEQARDLTQVFDTELASLQSTVANASEVEIQLAPGVRVEKVFDRAFRQQGDRLFVSLGSFATQDKKTVLVQLAVPAGAEGKRPVADVRLAYTDLMQGGAASSDVSLSARVAPGVVPRLDPVVQARLSRTGTADSLDKANALFASGDVASARLELAKSIGRLNRQKNELAKSPKPAPARVERDIDRQVDDLSATINEFEQAEQKAPAPAAAPDSREGKAGQKRAGGRVLDNRL